ncbi:hypothetical protein KVV02_005937 [Mortierella alpina]|uniref:J domain-containing protein n=1 Tax=Mortierella alpina TaxID=64518 RepID=A0A9P8IEJ1_MORAP|nr:hypothetical protein KVV02_005937 [Mortierella alpina]
MVYQETFAGIVGWTVVPNFVTNTLHSLWYSFRYSTKSAAIPPRGSAKHTRDRNWILCGVVLVYLVYLIRNVDRALEPSHYDVLDLGFHSFTQKQLKTNFRKASLQYHPDKAGDTGADVFVRIRAAHEVLSDPTLRQAYDWFGPASFKCTTCQTTKDYLRNGINEIFVMYGTTAAVLMLMGWAGRATYGRYWRYTLLAAIGLLELSMVQNTSPNRILGWLMPHRVTFEQIVLLRQIYLSTAIAIPQIGPILWPSNNRQPKISGSSKEWLKRLEDLTIASNDQFLTETKWTMEALTGSQDLEVQLREQFSRLFLECRLHQDQHLGSIKTSIVSRMVADKA